MRFFKPNHSCRAQTALEYLLILAVVSVVVFVSFNNLMPRVNTSSQGYFNGIRDVVLGAKPEEIDGGWCEAKFDTTLGTFYRTCECPSPAFGGDDCGDDDKVTSCTPSCNGRNCGPDGCGGTCPGPQCTGPNKKCNSIGQCVCVPTCGGAKPCGADNGCGEDCRIGVCSDPKEMCNSITASCCKPDCGTKKCGSDGCDGSCGTCSKGKMCDGTGTCVCKPKTATEACGGKVCGSADNGCGGTVNCGTCSIAGQSCDASGQCVGSTPTCTKWSYDICNATDCGFENGTQDRTCIQCNGSGPCPTPIIETLKCSGKNCYAGQTCDTSALPWKCVSINSCPTGQQDCNGVCKNTSNDKNNCGGCDARCGTAQTCVGGSCACPDGQLDCNEDGTCIPVNTNERCGYCYVSCSPGETCSGGACTTFCPPDKTNCNGVCANLFSDNNHCGLCGRACSAGQTCTLGACVSSCPSGQTYCNGVCKNLQTDNNNCGACSNVCFTGSICAAGSCQVPTCTTWGPCTATACGTNNGTKSCLAWTPSTDLLKPPDEPCSGIACVGENTCAGGACQGCIGPLPVTCSMQTSCSPLPSCGGWCGPCPSGEICDIGGCRTCIPDCSNRQCGTDPICGFSCGTCSGTDVCNNLTGQCGPLQCWPTCTSKQTCTIFGCVCTNGRRMPNC